MKHAVTALFLSLTIATLVAWGGGARAEEDKPVVYFGVIPRYNPMVMYRNYQPIMDYLTENTSYHFELKLSRDYTEAVKFLRNGVTTVASLGDVTFVEAYRDFGARPILKPLNSNGKPYYRSIIIVAANSGIQTLADLKGKVFAFGDIHSTSGNLIPRYQLFQNGITLFDLGRYENFDSHDAVVKAVLKGKVEAGAVKDVVAERYLQHGLRFLASSDPIPAVPLVVRNDAPTRLVEEVSRALLAIDVHDPATAARMATWDPEFRHGFLPASLEDYRKVIQMMETIPAGCGVKCH